MPAWRRSSISARASELSTGSSNANRSISCGAATPAPSATSPSQAGAMYRCSSSVPWFQRQAFSRPAGRISDMPGRNPARSSSPPRSRSITSDPASVNEM